MIIKIISSILIFISISSIHAKAQTPFSKEERAIINQPINKFRTLLVTHKEDSLTLRRKSTLIDPKDHSINTLWKLMLNTVNDTANQGVGIAAPQIGINKQIILVQRFDKSHQPFELMLNPKIIWASNLIQTGKEGCLSIPDTMGIVDRHYALKIIYQHTTGRWIEEVVEGFTAVILQHEIDHLHGILFTDRLREQQTKQYYKTEQNFMYLNEMNTR